jgi:hypothetical protein
MITHGQDFSSFIFRQGANMPIARKNGKCPCGLPITPGQKILFERATGKWVHIECWKKEENEDQQKLEI